MIASRMTRTPGNKNNRSTKSGKNSKIVHNPLEIALRTGNLTATDKRRSRTQSAGGRTENKLEDNELARRLGESQGSGKKIVRRNQSNERNSKPVNQLEVALGLARPNRNAVSHTRSRLGNGVSSKAMIPRQKHNNQNNSSNNISKPNLKFSASHSTPKPALRSSNKMIKTVNKPITEQKFTKGLTFRNASLIPFIRIENLIDDASESDILLVLSKMFGPILKILKMRSNDNNGNTSITAEIFLFRDDNLEDKAKRLDGVVADGRRLRAKVDYHSWIINSDRLWEEELNDVRMSKQQLMKRLSNIDE